MRLYAIGKKQISEKDVSSRETRWSDIFEVRPPTIKDAGMGLFAARSFVVGECLGVYYGRVKSAIVPTQPRSDYSLSVSWPPDTSQRAISSFTGSTPWCVAYARRLRTACTAVAMTMPFTMKYAGIVNLLNPISLKDATPTAPRYTDA